MALQEVLELSEPPHFLVPCYTATLDRWFDASANQIRVFAEAYPPVFRYRALLNTVFESGDLNWKIAPSEEICDPAILETYRHQFPELWENHDLVMRFDPTPRAVALQPTSPYPQGYVLRLFVSGYSAATARILQNLHALLEESLEHPYTLKVIDIFKHPEQAESDQVSATPTLVKVYPLPVRRIVGNLEDADRVLQILGALDEGWRDD
ncbi:MAG: circadian clock KaiB family protein [Leptolyngbya sp. Prado105]|jgi:circadian clock protein KaiB|nr:circadian clock KaiB family protein [Leptolyngbya sp. Prado105]